jgi:hypothetical protein
LTHTPGTGILFVGDSWTQEEVLDPNKSEYAADSALWNARTVAFAFPGANGLRSTDTTLWRPVLGSDTLSARWTRALNAGVFPRADQFAKTRFYSHAATSANRLSSLLGENKYFVQAMGGGRLLNSTVGGTVYPTGMQAYGLNNPWWSQVGLIVSKICINDINAGATVAQLKAAYIALIDAWYAGNPKVKILIRGMQPIGDDEYGEGVSGPLHIARADSLDAWICGRAPYYDDSTGLKQSLEGHYRTKVWNGQLAGFSAAHWLRNYRATHDTGTAIGDTLAARFNSGDDLHVSRRGAQMEAQVTARYVFQLAMPVGADTLDEGNWPTPVARAPKTICVNAATGDNFKNWYDPTNPAAPMATIQGAIFRAQPGDVISCAADEYCDYWRKSVDGYFKPWGHFYGASDRITIEGNGSTVTAQTGVDRIYITGTGATSHTHYPDSIMVADYTLKGFTFANWNATAGAATWPLTSMTGMKFDGCTWTNCNKVASMIQATGIVPPAPLTLEIKDSAVNEWDVSGAYNASNYAVHVDAAAVGGFLTDITLDGLTVTATGVTRGKHPFFYTDQADVSTTSAGRLKILRSTFTVDSLTDALFRPANDTDMIFAHNKVMSGSKNRSTNNEFIYSATGSGDGDTLWCVNNIIEFRDAPVAPTQRCAWNTLAAWFSGNLHNCGADSLYLTDADYEREFAYKKLTAGGLGVALNMATDTVYYGGTLYRSGVPNIAKTGWPILTLASLGITTARTHASIGPTQHTTEDLFVSKSLPARAAAAAQIESPWKLLQLINNGILHQSDSLRADTWYTFRIGTSEQQKEQYRRFMAAYDAWPVATRQKVRPLIEN